MQHESIDHICVVNLYLQIFEPKIIIDTMDLVLEIVDTFIADFVYAYLFPIGYSTKTEVNASAEVILFQIEPSQAAYMSTLSRTNVYRQASTLFFIAW